MSALPGYIAGDRMNSPTKSKGKRTDPYPHGPDELVSDIHLAVAQFKGTPQIGQLAGMSPKGMLEAKIRETEWHAQVPDEATFDPVFSKEVRRDVRKGLNALLKDVECPVETDAKAAHRPAHRRGLPAKLAADSEVQSFVEDRLDTDTFGDIAKEVAETFSPERRVSRSSIHRWWQKIGRK